MTLNIDRASEVINPLDTVEELLTSNNWVFSRMNDHELIVSVKGKACDYRLFFIWQDDMNAMQFCCQYDMTLEQHNAVDAAAAIMSINENLWMGHFDLPSDTNIPSFRHTSLLRGVSDVGGIEHIEDLVDISLAQCERYYNIFRLLAQSNDNQMDGDTMSLALMDTVGKS